MTSMDPDPRRTPDLEPGGGVRPGATPPDTPQTSGLSAPEPETRHRFPPTGILAIGVTVALAVICVVVVIALLTLLG